MPYLFKPTQGSHFKCFFSSSRHAGGTLKEYSVIVDSFLLVSYNIGEAVMYVYR